MKNKVEKYQVIQPGSRHLNAIGVREYIKGDDSLYLLVFQDNKKEVFRGEHLRKVDNRKEISKITIKGARTSTYEIYKCIVNGCDGEITIEGRDKKKRQTLYCRSCLFSLSTKERSRIKLEFQRNQI